MTIAAAAEQDIWNVTQHDPERYPYVVLRGTAANLSALRGTDENTRSIFFEERSNYSNIYSNNHADADAETETETEPSSPSLPMLLLENSLAVSVTVTTVAAAAAAAAIFGEEAPSEEEEDDDDDDDDDNGDNNDSGKSSSSSSSPPQSQEATTTVTTGVPPPVSVEGDVYVTGSQVLFVARDRDQAESDLAVGAGCIVLHALTEEPEPAVYLQLASDGNDVENCDDNDNDNDNDYHPFEVTLTPRIGIGTAGGSDPCQDLFDALCRLISLHPAEDDDNDGNGDNGFFGGGFVGGGFGDDWVGDYGESLGEYHTVGDDGDGDGDELVWAPSANVNANVAAGAATTEERYAMLERLDSLLVVAPGLEVAEDNDDDQNDEREPDGQFDDAE